MENNSTVLDRLIKGLQSEVVNYSSTELCSIDDYKIVISLNNVSFYDVKENSGAVGERNIVNSGLINGDNNLNAGDISISSLDKWQRTLLGIYDCLDSVSQARLITYANKLSKKGGEAA